MKMLRQTKAEHRAGAAAPSVPDTVLIVEDTPASIEILSGVLADDYAVSVALDGPSALKLVETVNPDLILLDIMMPGMDGYEVCAKLKGNPATSDIPVVFLAALHEEIDEVKGLALGAADYIVKPFNPVLVKACVRNQLALRHARIEMLRQREQIEAACQKLSGLERLRDDLVQMIVHDMRSPLTGLGMFLNMFSAEDVKAPDFESNLRLMRETCQGLCDMVSSLLDVSRIEAGQMPIHPVACELEELTNGAIRRLGELTHGRQVSVRAPRSAVVAHCDPVVTQRIFETLLGNALKFSPPDGTVRIELADEEEWARFSISDSGPGIPFEYHQKVFEKSGQVEIRKQGKMLPSGLGLVFCKLATEEQGGEIGLESEQGHGATFHVRLPKTERSI